MWIEEIDWGKEAKSSAKQISLYLSLSLQFLSDQKYIPWSRHTQIYISPLAVSVCLLQPISTPFECPERTSHSELSFANIKNVNDPQEILREPNQQYLCTSVRSQTLFVLITTFRENARVHITCVEICQLLLTLDCDSLTVFLCFVRRFWSQILTCKGWKN